MLLDSPVAPDRHRRKGVASLLDIGVDGLRQGGSLRSGFGPFARQVFGFDGPGLPDAGRPVRFRDRYALATQPQLNEIIS